MDENLKLAVDAYRKARTAWYELPGTADSEDALSLHTEMEERMAEMLVAAGDKYRKALAEHAVQCPQCLEAVTRALLEK